MKKTLIALALIFCCISVCKAQQQFEAIYSDVTLFWQAFDRLQQAQTKEDSIAILEQEYIAKASPGVEQFMQGRISSGKYLQKTISKHRNYYTYLRNHTSKLDQIIPRLDKHYKRLKRLYPETDIPKVYFVIGALNSAGTIKQDPIVGVDMFGYYPDTPKEELSPWLKSVLRPIEAIDVIVLHEMVHVLQKGYDGTEETLLKRSIGEGAADFVGELVTKSSINEHVYAYGNKHEHKLWLQFKDEMHGTDVSNWLYNGLDSKERPADLGYFGL
ncbi:gliding motility protein GldB-related protein [Pontibacter sp. H249]|uniref:gliding motility protein GldB-related protein n=1 Tax=Pontibacter sp. H249 TaxID=3133420 RepID=UPI0030C3240D